MYELWNICKPKRKTKQNKTENLWCIGWWRHKRKKANNNNNHNHIATAIGQQTQMKMCVLCYNSNNRIKINDHIVHCPHFKWSAGRLRGQSITWSSTITNLRIGVFIPEFYFALAYRMHYVPRYNLVVNYLLFLRSYIRENRVMFEVLTSIAMAVATIKTTTTTTASAIATTTKPNDREHAIPEELRT